MSWLTKYVRPKIKGLFHRDVPDNLWTNCESCSQMLLVRDLEKNLQVCPHCGLHMKIRAADRLKGTFDDGKFTLAELPSMPHDPLKFRDSKRYADRLKESRAKSGLNDSLLVASGKIQGHEAVVAVMAFEFMAGTMGAALGEAFLSACRMAVLQRAPLIIFTASGGARMQEGAISLMQMPRTTIGVQMLREAGLPYIVVFTDPTTGGVSASFAMLGDIHIAEPKALIAFAGPRVIRDTVREELPEGFQRSEYLLQHGMIDFITPRRELPELLGRLVGMLTPADRLEDAETEAARIRAEETAREIEAAEGRAKGEEADKSSKPAKKKKLRKMPKRGLLGKKRDREEAGAPKKPSGKEKAPGSAENA